MGSTSRYSLYSWSSMSVSYRSRSSALMAPTLRLQEGRTGKGPDAQDGPADHLGAADGPEDPAVGGVGPVVAHHPEIAGGHRDRAEVGHLQRRWQVGLHQLVPVDEHVPVPSLEPLPGK